MLLTETCRYCKGSGKAESLQERTSGGAWVANTMLDHALADAWIKADPIAPVRWQECACPVCAGEGQYLLEFTRCKIF